MTERRGNMAKFLDTSSLKPRERSNREKALEQLAVAADGGVTSDEQNYLGAIAYALLAIEERLLELQVTIKLKK
jgi:hypothetical protein